MVVLLRQRYNITYQQAIKSHNEKLYPAHVQ